jgi:hypothetical protein
VTENLRALILDDAPIGYLDDLKRRFPTVAFDAITAYADLPAALSRHRPDVALVNKVEKVPFPRAALLEHFAARPRVGYAVVGNVASTVGERLQVFQAMWLREMKRVLELSRGTGNAV